MKLGDCTLHVLGPSFIPFSGVVCYTGFVTTSGGNPHLVLPGHRSIVNQTRYSKVHQVLASSGVEKVVKVSKCVVSPSMDLPSMLPMACSCGVPLLLMRRT